jgi:hypothetical protein
MPRGLKTVLAGATAAVAFPFCFIDPTGASQITFLTASAACATGATVHTARHIKHGMECRRPTDPQDLANVRRAEEAIRRLSAAATGCGIQGTLSLVLPHCLVGLALNGAESIHYQRQLRAVRRDVGGRRKLFKKLSKRNIAFQMVAGATIKGSTTALLMGTEFDTWLEHMGLLTESLPSSAESMASASDISDLISIPVDEVKEELGYTPGTDWTWDDHIPKADVAIVGATATAAETVAAMVLEIPLHHAAGKASGSRPSKS